MAKKMIRCYQTGTFKHLDKFLRKMQTYNYDLILEKYAKEGVNALKHYTPVDTGETANSWAYQIVKENDNSTIYWKNTNVQNGIVVAVLIQYGHATHGGGYVQGTDYINPAMKRTFEEIAKALWEEVTSR